MQREPEFIGAGLVEAIPNLQTTVLHPARVVLHVGSMVLGQSYSGEPDRVWLGRPDGEGGDFPTSEVEAILQAYYTERF